MHRLFLIVALAFGLGGCSNGFSLDAIPKIFTVATASVTNPVTPKMLYQVDQGLIAVTEGLLVYKNSCARQIIARRANLNLPVPTCRAVIAQIQVYTRQAKPLLVSLRTFIRGNDQINAVAAYNELQDILAKIDAVRVANGVA